MNKSTIKVYVGDYRLVFMHEGDDKGFEEGRRMRFNAALLFEEIKKIASNILVFCNDTEAEFEEFKKQFKFIEAAGGLIHNDRKQYLFIYRHEKWDLPKGKLEKGELTDAAAVRECQEECGIEEIMLENFLHNTYHIYPHKESYALKKTYWYNMFCRQENFIPQLEESITWVGWKDISDFPSLLINSHKNIRDVLKAKGLLQVES